MIVLSKEKLSQMVVGAVICPIKTDCCFETRFSKQVKDYLEELDPQFDYFQYSLSTRNIEIGEFFKYELKSECHWQQVYFLTVKDFLNQLTFASLSEMLTKVILELYHQNIMSVFVPILSLGYFDESVDAEILAEGFLRAYEAEPKVAQMKIIVKNDTREEFNALLDAFENLPKALYRKPKFMVENQRKRRNRHFPHKNISQD